MMKFELESTTALQALGALVKLCKHEGCVRDLAQRLKLTRQAVYLWDSEECTLSERAAKLRLLEISRLSGERFASIAGLARQAVEHVEAQESACLGEKA